MFYRVECGDYCEVFDNKQDAIDYAFDIINDEFSWEDGISAEIAESPNNDEDSFEPIGEVGFSDPEIMFFESSKSC